MIWINLLTILLLAVSAYSNYTGYQLIRISPKTKQQIDLVGSWQHNTDFDVWSTKMDHIDVLLSPEALKIYKPILDENTIQYKVINKNIQDAADEEARSIILQKMLFKATNQRTIIGTFASHSEINNWIDSLPSQNSYLSIYSAGTTYEGRDLKVIKFKTPSTTRAIWIDCGIHAREWISPATCVWIINSLINEYNANNPDARTVLNKYEIHILPVHNPDGYEYSRSDVRLWRKNRNKNPGSTCIGVDLNRNFGYKWLAGGASTNPCAETYAGPTPDSELETKAVENAINALRGKWDAFFTIHTYGLYWFTPWGYTADLPSDYNELVDKIEIGAAAAKAVYGSVFEIGSSTNLLYIAAGGSDDWAKGVAGIKYSHCLELRPGGSTDSDGFYGFQLPVDRAPKAGEETYRGILAFLKAL